jgi:hypothetical protein
MTAKPVPEHISDERLAEVRRLASVEENDCLRDGARSAAQYHADVGSALIELQHRREAEAEPAFWHNGQRQMITNAVKVGKPVDEDDARWISRFDQPLYAASPSSPASGVRVKVIDWQQSPPFITSISGDGSYEVNVKVHSMAELHAAHDLVLKAFSDAHSDLLAKRWADANQG